MTYYCLRKHDSFPGTQSSALPMTSGLILAVNGRVKVRKMAHHWPLWSVKKWHAPSTLPTSINRKQVLAVDAFWSAGWQGAWAALHGRCQAFVNGHGHSRQLRVPACAKARVEGLTQGLAWRIESFLHERCSLDPQPRIQAESGQCATHSLGSKAGRQATPSKGSHECPQTQKPRLQII